jgi:hypothetical protein
MPPKPSIPRAKATSPSIPKAKSKAENRHWTFSFRYWSQIDNFGLDVPKVDAKWFASLLLRLKDLSSKTIEGFMANSVERDAWRYHKINWNQPNIPITKQDFEKLVPATVITEDTDICQFTISMANGRVVGFFDHQDIFQIVLLDPLHNIQPSKLYDYAVDPTKVALTEIEAHRQKLTLLKKELDGKCVGNTCDLKESVSYLLEVNPANRFFCLNDYLKEDEIKALAEKFGSIDEIVLQALSKL